jgi:hypothetical protein
VRLLLRGDCPRSHVISHTCAAPASSPPGAKANGCTIDLLNRLTSTRRGSLAKSARHWLSILSSSAIGKSSKRSVAPFSYPFNSGARPGPPAWRRRVYFDPNQSGSALIRVADRIFVTKSR